MYFCNLAMLIALHASTERAARQKRQLRFRARRFQRSSTPGAAPVSSGETQPPGRMPLIQITDAYNEPLDLWLSPNHEGQTRFVRESDIPKAVADADDTDDANLLERADDDDGADDKSALCLPCEVEDEASVVRVPAPPPVGLVGLLKPIPTVLPHPDKDKELLKAVEDTRKFSSEAGVPTVFVTRPPRDVICRACRDVYRDPVIAHDGFTYCRQCAPKDFDSDDDEGIHHSTVDPDHDPTAALVEDHDAWEKVLAMQILCKNGLTFMDNAAGANRWVYNPEGCTQSITLEARAKHELDCGYRRARCSLPYGRRDNDSCPVTLYQFEREEHQRECPFRLVNCGIEGCAKRIQFNRRAQHTALCERKTFECANGCGWRGARNERAQHKNACELEVVTCGREDTEDPSLFCTHLAERRFMSPHANECEYRPTPCAHCKRKVSARHAAEHEKHCEERRVLCDDCGARVLERHLPEHREVHCGKGSFRCEFQKYGCAERGTRAELERHCADDAARHLRLVMLQLDAQHEKYARWYREVDDVKETVAERVRADDEVVAAVNAEVRRVEDEGKAEIVTLRRGLADLRAYYEEEVGRLQAQMKRVAKDSDARVADLRAENAALRTALSDKMTKDEMNAFVADASAFRETLEHETARARDEMDRHRQRWERDVSRVHEDIKDVRAMCDERVKAVDAAVAKHEASDHLRVDAVEAELHEANKEFVDDLDELARRQRDLEQRWQETNEALRGPRKLKESVRDLQWAETRAPEVTRPAVSAGKSGSVRHFGMGTTRDEKGLARSRAQGAAALLFGKGSRMDPVG